MTRIIAGQARGRRLSVPGKGTRPTADRVREALFASLESRLLARGQTWSDVAVCDLWSGSGAMALEAWSRGSKRVLAIERAAAAVSVIESNIEALGAGAVHVQRGDVGRMLASDPPGGAFDVVLADPPYDDGALIVRAQLEAGQAHGWFAPQALVVVERGRRQEDCSPLASTMELLDERTYGDTVLWYGRVTDGREEDPR